MRLDAIIIGAGFSGLYQLHCLRDRLGLSVKVLEAAPELGGTWYWNRYPGARCDSESHSYCYFFSRELLEEWEWSERYPGPPEILRYLNHVADRFDLRRDIRFGTRVVGVHYDEAANLWSIETASGERAFATYLVAAVGCLSAANVPDIPGLGEFAGRWFHTGEWPREGVDFRGKRVGQIGTGSTGIQAAPVIAQSAARLTVFQRTAQYSVPARNQPLSDAFRQHIRGHHEEIREVCRSTPNGHPFRIVERSAFDVSPAEREAIYEAAWEKGGLQFRATFRDLVLDTAANDTAAEFIKRKIREIVRDPDTAQALADIDHPYAAKRPPIDTDYFETFNRDNVALVDLRSDPIERITPLGIRTRSREHPLDIIVFATGFDAMTGPLLRLGIRGRGGLALEEAWRAGPSTYLGLQVPGFPNLFTVTGPGSPSVLTNMPIAIEQHVEWITDCIGYMRRAGIARCEPDPAASAKWGEQVDAAANKTVLALARHSWYFGANIPGKPRVFMPYAGGLARYRAICDDVAARGYAGFVMA
ncbi:MAG TPA: NAD(P)/FAD-dependent oxidoreductase [Burkholderiales bacterium]|nr:NAD(P)/FAD-dependent oxidoreductase [Burkholderiales bacterium]